MTWSDGMTCFCLLVSGAVVHAWLSDLLEVSWKIQKKREEEKSVEEREKALGEQHVPHFTAAAWGAVRGE